MFCPKCGNQLEDSASFCDSCGCRIADARENPAVSYGSKPAQVMSKSSGRFKIWMLPLIAVVAAVIFILVILPMLNSKSKLSVDDVKNSQLEGYEEMTIGKAFERYFENTSWESFESDDGLGVVEFKGTFPYDAYAESPYGGPEIYFDTIATIQFVCDPDVDNDNFYVYGVWFEVIDENAYEWMKEEFHLDGSLPNLFIDAVYSGSNYPYWVFGADYYDAYYGY